MVEPGLNEINLESLTGPRRVEHFLHGLLILLEARFTPVEGEDNTNSAFAAFLNHGVDGGEHVGLGEPHPTYTGNSSPCSSIHFRKPRASARCELVQGALAPDQLIVVDHRLITLFGNRETAEDVVQERADLPPYSRASP